MNNFLKAFVRFFLFFLLIGAMNVRSQQLPNFTSGDRVVFIGNSITQSGQYQAFFNLYMATRFPEKHIAYYNCGVAGDVAGGILARLDKDILSHKPTHAFLMTGMNDVNRYLYTEENPDEETLRKRKEALESYYTKTQKIADQLVKNNISLIFLTPTIYDETAELDQKSDIGTNIALGKCAAHIRKMAKKYKAPVVDFYALMNIVNLKVQKQDAKKTIIGGDRIHPGDLGHFVMGYELMKTIAPSKLVSKIIMDAAKGRVVTSDNSEVRLISKKRKKTSFEVSQNALPFPVKKTISEVLNLIPFQDNLNNEILAILNLKEGEYMLSIDSLNIGIYTAEVLQNGIDLASNTKTPQYKQAEKVEELAFEYHRIQGELRSIAFVAYRMLNKYKGENTLEAKKEFLDAEVESQIGKPWYEWNKKTVNQYYKNFPETERLELDRNRIRKELYKVNKPITHVYTIAKI